MADYLLDLISIPINLHTLFSF